VTLRLVPRYAIITTHNRPRELWQITSSLVTQVDRTVIIDNASNPPVDPLAFGAHTLVISDAEQPPNLYRLWNVGLTAVALNAADNGHDKWDVGIFNDDADVPLGWYDVVAAALRSGDYSAASTASHSPIDRPIVRMTPDGDLMRRMCPWAFVVQGELGLRADETFRWWYGDTDFEWQCQRLSAGVVMVPGPHVHNTLANSTTVGALAEQAGRDAETFKQKWGHLPW
jgi:hypothetical protein